MRTISVEKLRRIQGQVPRAVDERGPADAETAHHQGRRAGAAGEGPALEEGVLAEGRALEAGGLQHRMSPPGKLPSMSSPPLPKRQPTGCFCFQAGGLCGDATIVEPMTQIAGIVMIFDLKDVGMSQIKGLSTAFAKKMVHFLAVSITRYKMTDRPANAANVLTFPLINKF